VKDEQIVVDENRMELRDRNTLKKPDRYNVHSFIANYVDPLTIDESMTGPNMDS